MTCALSVFAEEMFIFYYRLSKILIILNAVFSTSERCPCIFCITVNLVHIIEYRRVWGGGTSLGMVNYAGHGAFYFLH